MNETTRDFQGSKGGGDAPAQTTTPDNLRSKDTFELLLGLCEGPIKGLQDGDKSLLVGDTSLQSQGGDYNFTAFVSDVFSGVDEPEDVKFVLGGASKNYSVGLPLATQLPVTRTTDPGEFDYIEVRINFSRLLKSSSSGTFNNTVEFEIEYKPTDQAGGWLPFYSTPLSISGKTTSVYGKDFRKKVPRITGSYDIRVTKYTTENTEENFSDISWDSFQTVTSGNDNYPNTALLHLSGQSSDQFSQLPQFSGVYDCLIIKVPTNYNPTTREYTGVWDGTFKSAFSNNPAWVLYDFITNSRFGIKSYYPQVVMDKYDVYEAAEWCDELVPDGQGGEHPRYTFNAEIASPRSGKQLAMFIAGTFNATFFDDLDGKSYLKVDKEDTATHLFTKENISAAGFSYSYTELSSRYNDITVAFINPDLGWVEDRRRVYDQDLIDKNSRITDEFVAVGCTNVQEALRRAHNKLITANTEKCICSFTTNRLGQFVNVFDTILVADPDMGFGLTGRIKTFTDSTITLRDPVYLEVGQEYFMEVTLKDGGRLSTELIDFHPSGLVTELQIKGILPEDNMPEKTVFTLHNTETIGTPAPFRVISVVENDGSADSYTITCININRNKWYDSDNITDSGVIDYSVLPSPLNPPGATHVGFEERYVKRFKEFQLTVSPTFPRGTYKYYDNTHSFEVWSRPKDSSESFVIRELKFGDTIINHPAGEYEFKILGKSFLGFKTDLDSAAIYNFNVTNPSDPPKDIDWIKTNKREVYWGYENPPDDFAGFEVRYHNQPGRTTWVDAIRPYEGLITKTNFYTNLISASARVIMVRAVDDFGTYSDNSAILYREQGNVLIENVLEEIDFHPAFVGTKVNCEVDGLELVALGDSDRMYSDDPETQVYDGGNFYTSVYSKIVYYPTFTATVDGSLKIALNSVNNGFNIEIREVGETIWAQIPTDMDISAGDYELRITLFGGNNRPSISELTAVIDVEDIEETHEDVVIPAEATRITTTKEYSTIKTVSVIIQNDGSSTAVTYRVKDKNAISGPEIELLDSAGLVTSGEVDIIIRGY